jgi:hypothetical protein
MSWRKRLEAIALAGGSIALSACFTGGPPCGNANPDPCICGRPDHDPTARAECDAETACKAAGGQWDDTSGTLPDGGTTSPHCDYPDARPPDAQ